MNFELFHGVVSEDNNDKPFLLDPISGAVGSLINDSKNQNSLHYAYNLNNSILVNSTTLDSYANLHLGNSILKIDVEGAENLVIAGGLQFIQKFRPHIFIETFDSNNLLPIEKLGYSKKNLDRRFNYLMEP